MRSVIAKGHRVGVILEETAHRVYFLGYGLYVKDEFPPKRAFSCSSSPSNLADKPMPRIELDNGLVVWGWETTCLLSEWDMQCELNDILAAREKKVLWVSKKGLARIRQRRIAKWK